jgi:GT2 family glycosyltransferase
MRPAKHRRAALGRDPLLIGEVELSEPIEIVDVQRRDGGAAYDRARLLVRVHGHPLGFVELETAGGAIRAADVVAAVDAELAERLAAHLAADGLSGSPLGLSGVPALEVPSCWQVGPPRGLEPFVSVIVCTRDRPASLRTCLSSLLAIDGPYEVLVIDNAPRTDATAEVVRELGDPRVRRVLEPRAGLSRARNRGAREARGEILAFTDDDVIVDRNWLRGLALGFNRAPTVACVTGIVPSAEIETPAQAIFEAKAAWANSFEPRLFDLEANRPADPLYPFTPGVFGAGANFAVSRVGLERVGEFDEALGAGSPAQGGEDLDFFLRVILAGLKIAYEPAALVWHVHRRDDAALRRQLHAYGSGLSAFVTKQLMVPSTAPQVIRRIPRGLARLTASIRADSGPPIPLSLRAREMIGLLMGPLAYLRERRRATDGAS